LKDLLYLSGDLIYPAKINLESYPLGFKFDKWIIDDFTPVLGHRSGEKAGIVIYNAHDIPCVFTLTYQSTTRPTKSGDSSIVYSPTPIEARKWVDISNSLVILQAHELKTIPVSFLIPSNAKTPDNFEFLITVKNETDKKLVTPSSSVRYLVTVLR
jgi:hypothetical protein